MPDDATTPPAFTPIRKPRAFESIIGQLEQMIVRGELRSGDKLPDERSLAEMLGVGRPSLREALRVLEGMEIIEVRPGAGAASGSLISREAGSALTSMLRIHLALGHFGTEDLIVARRAIERWTVRAAAEQRTQADIAELARILGELESLALDDHETFHQLDSELHLKIAQIAGNILFTRLMEALRDPVVLGILIEATQSWDQVVATARQDHRDLVAAIIAARPDDAEAVLMRHLGFYED